MRADILDGKLGREPSRTVADAIAEWLQGEASQLKSYNNLLSQVRAIRAHCNAPLSSIVAVAESVKSAGIKAKLNPGTINRRLALLRRVANLAYNQWGWLRTPLASKIKLLPGETVRAIFLTPDQVDTLAAHCTDERARIAVQLAARTGMREAELLAADTIFDGCIVVGNSKTGRPRLVPVPCDMPDLVLPIGISYAQLRKQFESARRAAGMPTVRFHDLRHTAASWWAQAGANMAILRDLLGHTSLATTSRYSHLVVGDLKKIAADVGKNRVAKNNN